MKGELCGTKNWRVGIGCYLKGRDNMVYISEEEYKALEERIKNEIIKSIKEEQMPRQDSYTARYKKERENIYNDVFGDIVIDHYREFKIKNALITAANVLRPRKINLEYQVLDRNTSIKCEEEYEGAVQTYRMMCNAMREAYCEDFYKTKGDGKGGY